MVGPQSVRPYSPRFFTRSECPESGLRPQHLGWLLDVGSGPEATISIISLKPQFNPAQHTSVPAAENIRFLPILLNNAALPVLVADMERGRLSERRDQGLNSVFAVALGVHAFVALLRSRLRVSNPLDLRPID